MHTGAIAYLKDPTADSPFDAAQRGAMAAAVHLAGHYEAGRKRWPAMLLSDEAVEEAVARLDKLEVGRGSLLWESGAPPLETPSWLDKLE